MFLGGSVKTMETFISRMEFLALYKYIVILHNHSFLTLLVNYRA